MIDKTAPHSSQTHYPEHAPGFVYRVYYEDTDGAGVVYHANYLRFMERARTDWLRSFGINQSRLRADCGVVFTVARAALRFLKPAVLDDELRVQLCLHRRRRVSIEFAQRVMRVRDAALLCEAEINVACIHEQTLRPCAIPTAIVSAIAKEPVRVS